MKIVRVIAFAVVACVAVPSSSSDAAPTIAELQKDRVAAAEKAFTSHLLLWKGGRGTVDPVYQWSVRWLDAALDGTPRAMTDAIKRVYADHAKRMQELDIEVGKKLAAGLASAGDRDAAAYYHLEAELWAKRGSR